MAIKLIKACKELNIGMSTAVEFCAKMGQEISLDPNARIDDERYLLLAKTFQPDLALKLQAELENKANTTSYEKIQSKPAIRSIADTSSIKHSTLPKTNEQQNIDSPQVGQTIEGRVKNIAQFGVFVDCGFMVGLVHISEIADEPVVDANDYVKVGQSVFVKILKIDRVNNKLSLSIKKATKQATGSVIKPQKKLADNITSKKGISTTSEDVKEIWKYYIDIQEYLLQQKSQPIDIKSETIDYSEKDGKFWVEIDDSTELHIQQIVKEYLKIENFDCKTDCIQVNAGLWNSMSAKKKNELQEKLSTLGVDINVTPSINIDIQYGQNIERIDQMTLENIRQLDDEMQEGTTIKGHIEEVVAFISRIRFDLDEHIYKLFGDHALLSQNSTSHKYSRNLRYKNSYIDEQAFYEYRKLIGLTFTKYHLVFHVMDKDACEYLHEKYEISKILTPNSLVYSPGEKAFVFDREVSLRDRYKDIIDQEIHQNISIFLKALGSYYTGDNVEIECIFNYTFSREIMEQYLSKQLYSLVTAEGLTSVSISPMSRQIGIDFNWKTENIQEKIQHICSLMSGVSIDLQDSHRFKCRVQSSYVGYEKLKKELEDTFENIHVSHDELTQTVHISMEYDYTYYTDLCKMLVTKLEALGYDRTQISLKENEEGKIRLNYTYNYEDKIKDIEATLVELRTADFAFEIDADTIPFGKLLRVEYPKLYFDVTYPQENRKVQIDELLNNQQVSVVVPVLTGDREKLTRLKNTYGRALSGEGLQNGNLSQFMFDSSLATITKDIEEIIKEDGVAYQEMKRNILNPHINPSQMKAILKAIYAEDLAVIQGPPGTGKSTAISELIWQLVREGEKRGNAPERILLTSETNLAVDNAIARTVNNKTNLIKPIRFGDDEKLAPEGQQFSVKLMKDWVEDGEIALEATGTDDETGAREEKSSLILRNWLDNISRRSFGGEQTEDNEIVEKWKNVLAKPNQEIRELVFKNYQAGCNVVGATCSSIGIQRADDNGITSFYRKYVQLFAGKGQEVPVEFTHVIQDESSKATPAELIQPFVYGNRAIVIGDHRQLPPMLDQEEIEESLDEAYKQAQSSEEADAIKHLQDVVHNNFKDLEISHFQRLYENIDTSLRATFNLQYRMHPAINEVIEQFYKEDGGLRCGWTVKGDMGVDDPDMSNPASRYHGITIDGLMDENTHVLFINTESPEMMDGTSRVNYGEIEVVDKLLAKFEDSPSYQKYLQNFSKEEDRQIGVISFYGKQVRQLQNVARKHSTLPPTRVSTVDRFQGMERNIVIVSMVRSDRIQGSRNQVPDMRKYPETGGYPQQTSLGFAQSPNRLNVALSRARRLLIIVGNEKLFSKLDIYKNLFQTIRNEKNPYNRVINATDL